MSLMSDRDEFRCSKFNGSHCAGQKSHDTLVASSMKYNENHELDLKHNKF